MPPNTPYPPREPLPAGEWMRAIRRAHGYSLADFAKFLGVEPERLAHWEDTNKLPSTKGRRRTLNDYARDAGLPELAFRPDALTESRRKRC